MQVEKLKDVLFGPHHRYGSSLPHPMLPVPFHSLEPLVGQLEPLSERSGPDLPVEHIAAREIHKSEGVLGNWVVLDVDAVVLTLKEAHTHV